MPDGKPAGVRCVQLTDDNRCALFGRPERPAVCAGFMAVDWVCAGGRAEALRVLGALEAATVAVPGTDRAPGISRRC